MPPYFFLSYAKADDGRAVQQFFRDLSDEIRVRKKLPDTEAIGCSGVEHFENRVEGLRTSCMMLALVSPNYLTDRAVEGDWRAFEQRKAGITRINWLRHHEPLPKVVASAPVFPPDVNGNRYAPLAVMIAAIGKYKTQYAEFVNTLSNYIIDSAPSPHVSELDSTPDEAPTTFKDPEEPDMKSQLTDHPPEQKLDRFVNHNVNQIIIDGAFFRTMAEGFKKTPGDLTHVSIKEPTMSAGTETANEKHLVFAIVDDEESRKRIRGVRDYCPNEFEIETFEDPEALLKEVNTRASQYLTLPDLFIINLELPGKQMQGRELIEQLTEKTRIRSAVIAIYKADNDNLPHGSEFEGYVALLPIGFTVEQLRDLMKDWAEVGRNRIRRPPLDKSRKWNPVFLSYSNKDKKGADHICSQLEFKKIGVWYAAETLQAGDEIFKEVKAGVEKAEIFVGLFSPNYTRSEYAHLELDDFYNGKKQTGTAGRVLIPVLYKCSTNDLKDKTIIGWCIKYQAIMITKEEPSVGFRELFDTIRKRLGLSR